MGNLIRRREGGGQLSPQRQEWDPFRMMREMLRWDPYREFGRTTPGALFNPDFEVKERSDAFVVKADLPGLAEKDLDISFTGSRLTISGQREEEKLNEGETYYAAERSFGAFSRAFMLPDNADPDHASADFKDGVLQVTVPKKAEEKAKKLSIGTGQKAKA